jgi:hypothetical protein
MSYLLESNKTSASENTEDLISLVKRVDTNVEGRNLISTRQVSVFEFKKILFDKCELNYPASISARKQLGLDKRYCSKKLRQCISLFIFGKEKVSNVVWSRLRKIAIAARTKNHQPVTDKSKILSSLEIEYIFLVAIYIKDRNLKYVPNINRNVLENFNTWSQVYLPRITTIEISYPLESEYMIRRIDNICDWFHPDSDKSSQIEYGKLNDLLKKTFYGYSPTPQYIGKLGFNKPTSRTYSFNDFVLIRNRFIQSRANQSRPTSFILFEQL